MSERDADGEQPAPSLYYLRTFHTVATERSFTGAGRALNLSQPAVSAHIRTLERYYRGSLFETRNRRVHLTAVGEALFVYTRRVFNLLEEASLEVSATLRGKRGALRLGASTTLGVYLLPSVLSDFVATHADVEVDVHIGTSADVIGWVLSDDVPFGLVEAPVNHRDLQVQPVSEDEMVLIAAPGHPLTRHGELDALQLAEVPILRRETGSGTQALVDSALERAGVSPPTLMNLGSTEALKQAVLARIGVAWVPRVCVLRELGTGELVRVTVSAVSIRRTHSLVRWKGSRLAPVAETFVDLVRKAAD
jgi:DNA-binding transcriptional LysR family regulator